MKKKLKGFSQYIKESNDFGSIDVENINESLENIEQIDESMADEQKKKIVKFLDKFPNNTQSWAETTDEVRDMAREAREFHTELDLDMLHDEWETNPKAPQPLDFRKLKSPSDWNTEGKAYILNMWDKMGDRAKDEFFDSFKEWFK